ncbi:MAG TPA: MBL fold metallo-hydrolase [Sandaracinaceae bacterium LLY-WYZ-13_1]|nr:MBL fold metallo-hydrolase [Sandaracinaceae bacterium LLY-WYZ-13_1]
MIFRQLHDPVSSTYTYVLADAASKQAVIIDSVFEQHARDAALVRELGLDLRYAVETHVHADHVTGAWLMKQAFGCEIVISKHGGAEGADVYVDEGDVIRFGHHTLEVRTTPGHTDGCVTYVMGDRSMAFTGDTLMIRGAGRTDFQQGDAAKMFHSIRDKIFSLPDECLLYPAHDYQGRTVTTVAEERAFNPRVGGEANEGDFVGYMENLGLPHPKKIDAAVPANLKVGRPDDGEVPQPATWGPVVQTFSGILEIDPEWVAQHRDAVHVLDVREPEELEDAQLGKIDGVQNIPIDHLRDRLEDVPKDKPVVTVCRSGRRSAQAMVILRKAGWTDVANLTGGMIRWNDRALPKTARQDA